MLAPLVANVLLKWLLGTELLMGTGGQVLGFDPARIAEFMVKGLANMLWVNAGPWHLSGLPWGGVGGGARLLVGIVVLGITTIALLSLFRVLRTRRRGVRVAEARRFLLFVALFLPLLLGRPSPSARSSGGSMRHSSSASSTSPTWRRDCAFVTRSSTVVSSR